MDSDLVAKILFLILFLIPVIFFVVYRIQKKLKRKIKSGWIVIALVMLVGAVFTYTGIVELPTALDSKTWTKTTAEIEYKNCYTKKKYSPQSPTNYRTTFYINLRYKYIVGETEYTGTNIHLKMNELYFASVACKKIGEDKVDIYYNPKNPEQSVVFNGLNIFTSYLTIGILILLGSVLFIIINKKYPNLFPFF